MAEHNFRPLLAHYPALIEDMRNTFTSHQFIIQLARRYQDLYVRALYTYRRLPTPENPTPFQPAHLGQVPAVFASDRVVLCHLLPVE